MNERIVELAKQCASEDHLAIYGGNYAMFAELIVKECIRIDKENRDAAPGVEIARYFGIEE